MKRERRENMNSLLFMSLNIFCVVSIVILNKQLYSPPYNFRFGNTLVAFHFLFTSLACAISQKLGVFEAKRAPWHEIAKLSLSQVGSVAFVNFSLLYNSVGMYQVLKLLNIPVICVMEFFWLGITYSGEIKISLMLLLAGIGVATVTEVQFSWIGFVHGGLATVATGVYQILAGTKQKQYSINALQLLHYQAPMSTLCLTILALLFDDIQGLYNYPFNTGVVLLITFTGVVAFGVNLTVFLIIGRTSPVTYQVVGHFKTCMVIVLGFLLLNEPVEPKNVGGILLAMVGMIWYTAVKQRESREKAKAKAEAQELEALKERESETQKALQQQHELEAELAQEARAVALGAAGAAERK